MTGMCVDFALAASGVEAPAVVARRAAELRLEPPIEVGCIVEAPPKRDVGDGAIRLRGILQRLPAVVEPPRHDEALERGPLRGEQRIRIAHADAGRRRRRVRVEPGIAQSRFSIAMRSCSSVSARPDETAGLSLPAALASDIAARSSTCSAIWSSRRAARRRCGRGASPCSPMRGRRRCRMPHRVAVSSELAPRRAFNVGAES